MLIEKEIIGQGTHWYRDEQTGLPRKLVVTPELTHYWADQGNKMLAANLTVPVPYEHDFSAHPMTPADKLKNNAGWVKEYRVKDVGARKDVLHGIVDIQDDDVARKLPRTIRWTSPWISSFTDGQGRDWKNVISHLALTTRPRVIEQAPFPSIAAALSMASDGPLSYFGRQAYTDTNSLGFCLSNAGRLYKSTVTSQLRPRYPMAFSLWGGAALAEGDVPKKKKDKKKAPPSRGDEEPDDLPPEEELVEGPPGGGAGLEGLPGGGGLPGGPPAGGMPPPTPMGAPGPMGGGMVDPLADAGGDVQMEELLCDLLGVLGVPMPPTSNPVEFKRHLYDAAICKIRDLAQKGQNQGAGQQATTPQAAKANTMSPAGGNRPNPLIQQEQQPMYMSLEEINKLDEPLKSVALSMYNETVKATAKAAEAEKVLNSLRDAKLKEEGDKRQKRVAMLGRLSPKVKSDLDTMLALPAMALSMGDGGAVVDPMSTTLAVLEKGLSDMPRMLTTDSATLAMQPQPTDGEMSAEVADKLADDMARMMGCPPEKKAG